MPLAATSDEHSDDYWMNFYQHKIMDVVINASNENYKYSCDRVYSFNSSDKKTLIEKITNSDIVIAVLTDYDPNVLYQLGMRHIVKSSTLILLESDNNQQKPMGSPAILDDCEISCYQKNNEESSLNELIRGFITKSEYDPYKGFLPYKFQNTMRMPCNTYRSNGFQDIIIPTDFVDNNLPCNILVINLHDNVFSPSMNFFLKNFYGNINLLYTTNIYIQVTRAMSLGRKVDNYVKDSGYDSNKYLAQLVKSNGMCVLNIKNYNTYPFGLYFQINDIIWYIPLWNRPKDETTSAHNNICVQVSRHTPFGMMLYNNFMSVWHSPASVPVDINSETSTQST